MGRARPHATVGRDSGARSIGAAERPRQTAGLSVRSGAVSSLGSASPVFTVPAGSIKRSSTSSSDRGQCSTPRGTTNSSPGPGTMSRSRSWIVSVPSRTKKKSSVSGCAPHGLVQRERVASMGADPIPRTRTRFSTPSWPRRKRGRRRVTGPSPCRAKGCSRSGRATARPRGGGTSRRSLTRVRSRLRTPSRSRASASVASPSTSVSTRPRACGQRRRSSGRSGSTRRWARHRCTSWRSRRGCSATTTGRRGCSQHGIELAPDDEAEIEWLRPQLAKRAAG